MCIHLPVSLALEGRLGLSVLGPLVKHGAVALVFLPLAAEHLNKGFLFIEAGVFLEDGFVLELAQTNVLLAFLPVIVFFGNRWLVMRNILGDIFLSFEQIQDTIFMLLQLIDVHVVEMTSTHRHAAASGSILLRLSSLCSLF